MTDDRRAPIAHQEVRAEGGYAYGCIGADIHVFGNGTPVYLLFRHRRTPTLDSAWLRAQPSRMLDARAELVDFVERDAELRELLTWRDSGPRSRVRWLHGEGGQGKTRLARQLAADAEQSGWKVVEAVHGTDAHPPAEGSQDLRLDGHSGVLLLVDYADRWPQSDMSWLFHNRLLRQPVPARVLLIGRSASGWPALRGKLNQFRENIDTSDQHLPPLPDDGEARARLFTTARDCFARRFPELTAPHVIAPPALSQPDFGLTLAVLLAALVAVDAAAAGRRAPADMVGLTVYLLDREHENWRQLYENAQAGLDYRTPDAVMARAVFTATVAGPTERTAAQAILAQFLPQEPAEQVLADHAVCYPPTDPDHTNRLEPLLPDRLAEDFLALTVPGHKVTGYQPDPWATAVPAALLTATGHTSRAVTLLASATDRWPHLGEGVLYPMLRDDPGVAVDAGSAALVAVAGIRGISPALLKTIEQALADRMAGRRHVDLDVGRAAVLLRLVETAELGADEERAFLYADLGVALSNAGRVAEAVEFGRRAIDLFSDLAQADDRYLSLVPQLMTNYAAGLARKGDWTQSLNYSYLVVQSLTAMAKTNPTVWLPELAQSLNNHALGLARVGRREEALEFSVRAVEACTALAEEDRETWLPELAASLTNHAVALVETGRSDEGLEFSARSVELHEQLADINPAAYLPELAAALDNHAHRLADTMQREKALVFSGRAVELRERLAKNAPDAHLLDLAITLSNHANRLKEAEQLAAALEFSGSAVELGEQLASANSEAHLPDLAHATRNHANLLRLTERWTQAVACSNRAVELYSTLADSYPRAHLSGLAASLSLRAMILAQAKQAPEEALRASERAVEIYRTLAQRPEYLSMSDLAWSTTTTPPAAARAGPERHGSLAHGLWSYAWVRALLNEELDDALPAAERACELYQELATREPIYVNERNHAYLTLADVLDALGNTDRADEILQGLAHMRATEPRRHQP